MFISHKVSDVSRVLKQCHQNILTSAHEQTWRRWLCNQFTSMVIFKGGDQKNMTTKWLLSRFTPLNGACRLCFCKKLKWKHSFCLSEHAPQSGLNTKTLWISPRCPQSLYFQTSLKRFRFLCQHPASSLFSGPLTHLSVTHTTHHAWHSSLLVPHHFFYMYNCNGEIAKVSWNCWHTYYNFKQQTAWGGWQSSVVFSQCTEDKEAGDSKYSKTKYPWLQLILWSLHAATWQHTKQPSIRANICGGHSVFHFTECQNRRRTKEQARHSDVKGQLAAGLFDTNQNTTRSYTREAHARTRGTSQWETNVKGHIFIPKELPRWYRGGKMFLDSN